jgi:hypothetical protein
MVPYVDHGFAHNIASFRIYPTDKVAWGIKSGNGTRVVDPALSSLVGFLRDEGGE